MVLALAGFAQQTEFPKMKEFGWLEGVWVGEANDFLSGEVLLSFTPAMGGKYLWVTFNAEVGGDPFIGEGYFGWSSEHECYVLHTFSNSPADDEPGVELAAVSRNQVVLMADEEDQEGDVQIRQTWKRKGSKLVLTIEALQDTVWSKISEVELSQMQG